MEPRVVRLLFRLKRSRSSSPVRSAVKVVTNVRISKGSKKNPKQLHVGYVSLLRTEIGEGDRRKLLNSLRRKWIAHFSTDQVEIDWEHATRRFKVCRTLFEASALKRAS